ncbi:unnamed protein product, partial [marine sediment metagenome]
TELFFVAFTMMTSGLHNLNYVRPEDGIDKGFKKKMLKPLSVQLWMCKFVAVRFADSLFRVNYTIHGIEYVSTLTKLDAVQLRNTSNYWTSFLQ